jgi:nuclear GTP-binding protein
VCISSTLSPLLLFSVQLDSKIKLIDSPGVIFEEDTNDAGLLLRNCISVDKLDDPIPAAEAIFARCRPAQLMTVYAMQRFDGFAEFILLLAKQTGKMVKGGVPNKEGAARMLLRDWNNGKIPFYTLPPEIEDAGKNVHLESKILATYSKEFDIDALLEVR